MLRVDPALLAHAGPLDVSQRREIESHAAAGAERILSRPAGPERRWPRRRRRTTSGRTGPDTRTGGRRTRFRRWPGWSPSADVYAAMCAPRPHRPALDPRAALTDALLLAERGQLDRYAAEKLLALGLYPAGTVVELADGSTAVVLAAARPADGEPRGRPAAGRSAGRRERPGPGQARGSSTWPMRAGHGGAARRSRWSDCDFWHGAIRNGPDGRIPDSRLARRLRDTASSDPRSATSPPSATRGRAWSSSSRCSPLTSSASPALDRPERRIAPGRRRTVAPRMACAGRPLPPARDSRGCSARCSVIWALWRWSDRPERLFITVVGIALEGVVFGLGLWVLCLNAPAILDRAGLAPAAVGGLNPQARDLPRRRHLRGSAVPADRLRVAGPVAAARLRPVDRGDPDGDYGVRGRVRPGPPLRADRPVRPVGLPRRGCWSASTARCCSGSAASGVAVGAHIVYDIVVGDAVSE